MPGRVSWDSFSACDAEVRDLHPAVAADEDVRRLHVAVDDPAHVRGMERLGDLGADPRGLARRQRAVLADDRRHVLAVDELHDDVRAGRLLAEVEDRDDVRVAQRRGGAGLVAEAGQEVRVTTELGAQQLDRDVAIQLGVARPVDRRHAALSEELHEAIAAAQDAPDLGHGLLVSPLFAARGWWRGRWHPTARSPDDPGRLVSDEVRCPASGGTRGTRRRTPAVRAPALLTHGASPSWCRRRSASPRRRSRRRSAPP
jgi:hypothetical protein